VDPANNSDAVQSRALDLIGEAYGLANATMIRLEQGAQNASFRVESGDHTFYLKRYESRLYRPDQVRHSLEIQNAVSQLGLSVPMVVLNRHGDITTETEDGTYALSTFVAGGQYRRGQIPALAARSMGETLGKLHLALGRLAEPRPYVPPDPLATQRHLERVLALALPWQARSVVDERSCRVLRHKLACLERYAPFAKDLPAMREQLVHGDYQETNLIFDDDERVAAVLDFDNLRFNPRAVEVTRTLSLCFLHEGILLPDADAFFTGYQQIMHVPESEVATYAALRTYLSCTIARPIEVRYLNPEAYQSRWDRFIEEPSDWWGRNGDQVTERLIRVSAQAPDRREA